MGSQGPRGDEPKRRRVFSASDKIAYLQAYEEAVERGEGWAYLRQEGLYSSLISEWRKQRDAGVLEGKKPGGRVVKLTAEHAEIARLKRENERLNKRLATTETESPVSVGDGRPGAGHLQHLQAIQTALDIMGKAHAVLA
ncbi:hypothetical protein ACQP1G_26150 [Nocardia sp. CA-107356]|uniref:hypothetical protein n=1 Tax=Nocardia sp. CA-107356 TaxID=3239972 RepID=UPI003D8AEF73